MKIPRFVLAIVFTGAVAFAASKALAVSVPDNGFGTADMPLGLPYNGQSPMHIINGLPPGTQINITAVMNAPTATIEQAGGGLGGTQSGAEVTFAWQLQGTGTLAGFNRVINMPTGSVLSFPGLPTAGIEVNAAPRTNGNPVQSFTTEIFRLFGQITGDPDFDLLRLVGGTDFGLPSPGQTTLTQNGGNWDVGSFYDLTYRIDFVGRPGGALSGMSGSTTDEVRLLAGVPEPTSLALLASAAPLLLLLRRRRR